MPAYACDKLFMFARIILETTLFQKKTHLRKQVGYFVGNDFQKVLSENDYQFSMDLVVAVLHGIHDVVDRTNNIVMSGIAFASVCNRFVIAIT